MTPSVTHEGPAMRIRRRESLTTIAALGALLAGAGFPQFAAANYNKSAFDARSVEDAVKAAGASRLVQSKDLTLNAPDVSENGAAVTLGAATGLSGVKHLLILVEKNPAPLAALFHLNDQIEANFSIRVKMGQTSDVFLVAIMNDGRALWAKREVKIMQGGCGA